MRSTLRRRSDIVAAVRYILIMYLILFLASYCLSSANNFLLQKKQIEAGRAGFTNEITFYAPLFNKDQIEELDSLIDWMENNKKAVNDLKQVVGRIRKVEEKHKIRTYVPRVLPLEIFDWQKECKS